MLIAIYIKIALKLNKKFDQPDYFLFLELC